MKEQRITIDIGSDGKIAADADGSLSANINETPILGRNRVK